MGMLLMVVAVTVIMLRLTNHPLVCPGLFWFQHQKS